MKKIVLLGAGRSAQWLIAHLRELAASQTIDVVVADMGLQPDTDINYKQVPLDASDAEAVRAVLDGTDFAISLLPPHLHVLVAEICVELGIYFASASYESDAIRALDAIARDKGIAIISECGLDPGLDHITAHAVIEELHAQGALITSFRSFCGGLPGRNNLNEWGYRFFWNPMNVILAGADGARFLQNGHHKLLPYHSVFANTWPIHTEEAENLVAYANRDSIPYIAKYGLPDPTEFVRGTIRYAGFDERWHGLVSAGITNNAIQLEADLTYGQWLGSFQHANTVGVVALINLVTALGWMHKAIGKRATSAQVLLDVTMAGWQGGSATADRVLLQHIFTFTTKEGYQQSKTVTLDLEGNEHFSAMAMTVGKPIAMLLHLYLHGSRWVGCKTPSAIELWPYLYALLPKFNLQIKIS